MGRNYTIEKHPLRRQIEKDLISGKPYSTIANEYGIAISCVKRYASQRMHMMMRSGALKTIDGMIDRIEEYIEKADLLYQSLCDWLTDPEDPAVITTIPRADEMDIIYSTKEDLKMVRHKTNLQELLNSLSKNYDINVTRVYCNTPDKRGLMLKTAEVLNRQLELLAKARGQIINNIQVTTSNETVDDLIALIQDVLKPYPEALIALSEALDKFSANVDAKIENNIEEGV